MSFYQLYLLFVVFFLVALAAILLKPHQSASRRNLALIGISTSLWTLGDLIAISGFDYATKFFGEIVRFIGVLSLPVVVLNFTKSFRGKSLSRKRLLLITLVPIFSFGCLVTNAHHGLFFEKTEWVNVSQALNLTYGPVFWYLHTPYLYSLILFSLLTLCYMLSDAIDGFRSQIIVLVASMCIPIFVNVISLAGYFEGINLNPLSFAGFMFVATFGITRFNLHRNPIAYETVFNTARDGIIILDNDSAIMDLNPIVTTGLQRKKIELISLNVNEVFSAWKPYSERYGEERVEDQKEIVIRMNGKERYFSIVTKPVKNADRETIGKILTIRNDTLQKLNQIALESLAFLDPLTMLANRRKFEAEFDAAVASSVESESQFAILYFDLNRFKAINDSHGHKIGDEMLKYVAARIGSILRKPDVIARLGGDEFAAILYNATEPGVKIAVERIIENTRRPFRVKDFTLAAELSVGAAFYPKNGETLVQLLSHADSAMYRAKSDGGGLAIFDPNKDKTSYLNH